MSSVALDTKYCNTQGSGQDAEGSINNECLINDDLITTADGLAPSGRTADDQTLLRNDVNVFKNYTLILSMAANHPYL